MATTLYRIIKHGLQNFWRHKLLSAVTLLVIILALLVFEGLMIFNTVAGKAFDTIQDKIDISVYFKTTTSEDDILRIKQSLENLSEVKGVEYISRDKALDIFKANHQNDQTIKQAIQQLGENPLEASLNIKAKDPSQYAVIASYLQNESLKNLVDKVSYQQNQVVIERLAKIVNYGRTGGLALTILFAFLAVLVAFNTILLAIYSNREEIEVMRLVGASNAFIRGPYIMEGIIDGVISAAVSVAVTTPLVYLVSPYLKVFIPGLDLAAYFTGNIFSIFGYQLLFGTAIGVISSFIAIRRYLKV
jgi:cell division transport system permease protein